MSTLENLFVQIFDRKKWIEDQLKQQRDLYDQYLASTLLINGIHPPSWLLRSGFEGGSADLKELKKEELISGLLFPPLRPNNPSTTHCSNLYRRPVFAQSYAQQSDEVFTETCASNKYIDVGGRFKMVSECQTNNYEHDKVCTLKGVAELDPSIASPHGQTDAPLELDQSLARIQRSRSRQKALELRASSNSKAKKRPHEDCNSTSSRRVTKSRTSGERTNDKELLELQNFPNTIKESSGRVSQSRFAAQKLNSKDKSMKLLSSVCGEDLHNTFVTTDLIQSSGPDKNELHKSLGPNIEEHSSKGGFTDACCGITATCEMTHIQTSCEELLKPNISLKLPSCRVSRSRSSSSNNASQVPNASNSSEGHDILKATDTQVMPCNDSSGIVQRENCGAAVAGIELASEVLVEVCPFQPGVKNIAPSPQMAMGTLAPNSSTRNNIYVEPKKLQFDIVENNLNGCSSPAPETEMVNGSPEMRASPLEGVAELDHSIASPQYQTDVPLELDQSVARIQRSRSRQKALELRASSNSKSQKHPHEDCNSTSCRTVRRPRTSGERTNDKELLELQNLPNTIKESSGRVTQSRFAVQKLNSIDKSLKSSSSVSGEDLHNKFVTTDLIQSSGPDKNLELHKSLGPTIEEHPSKGGFTDACCSTTVACETTHVQISCEELLRPDNTSKLPSCRVTRSWSSSSNKASQLPNASTSTEGHDILKSSDIQVMPCNDSSGIVQQEKCGAAVAGIELALEVPVTVCPFQPGVKNMALSPRMAMATLAPNPSTGNNIYVEPKKLQFDEVENNLNGRSSPSPEAEMVNGSPELRASPLEAKQSLKKINFSVEHHKKYCPSFDSQLVEKDQDLKPVNREESCLASSGAHEYSSNSVGMEKFVSESPPACTALDVSVTSVQVTSEAAGNSWPLCKRRKTEGLPGKAITHSAKLGRDKQPNQIETKDGSRFDMQFHFISSMDGELAHSKFTEKFSEEMYTAKCRKTDRYQSSLELQADEGYCETEGEKQHSTIPLGTEDSPVETFTISSMGEEPKGNFQHCLKDKLASQDFIPEDHQNFLLTKSKQNLGRIKQAIPTLELSHESEFNIKELFLSSVGSPVGDFDLSVVNQTMPEYERFSMGVSTANVPLSLAEDTMTSIKVDLLSTTNEHNSFLDQICRSTSKVTPLSQYSCNKSLKTPNIYQSLPNGLLEKMELRNTALFSDDINQLKTRYNGSSADVRHAANADWMASSSRQFDWGVRKPPTPPIRKSCQKITSVSAPHSSEQQQYVNPELTCFRIDEDTSTSEGNGNLDVVGNVVQEGSSPRDDSCSTDRDPLADVTNINPCSSVSVSKMFHDRGSLDSVNTTSNFHRTQMSVKQKAGNVYSKCSRSRNKDKENQTSSIVESSTEKTFKSPYNNRFSRPQLSSKASEKKESQTCLGKGQGNTNIASKLWSFVPLVQQKKLETANMKGKKVKVVALERAEAAKRVEEKRENDRKLKIAAKIERERARLEQEKIKQLELKKRNEEAERKRKEANMAAKKRMREEEERKEKEKKRKRMEQARRLQKDEKRQSKKNGREQLCKTANDKEGKSKELQNEAKQHQKTEEGNEIAECRKATETSTRTTVVPGGNAKKGSDIREVAEAFKMSPDKVERVSDFTFSFIGGSSEQSYDISPYQASDDEDEEEERSALADKKFNPTWAREEHLASVVPFLKQLDRRIVFPSPSFCSITEVTSRVK